MTAASDVANINLHLLVMTAASEQDWRHPLVATNDKHGVTLLMQACKMGQLEVVQLLLQLVMLPPLCNSDVGSRWLNARESISGMTSVMEAACNGQVAVLQLLLDHPAIEVDLVDNNGDSLLHHACRTGRVEVVRLLLETEKLRVNKNAFNSTKINPLMIAANQGHVEVVKLLLEHRADISAADKQGQSAFLWAARKANFVVCQLILHSLTFNSSGTSLRQRQRETINHCTLRGLSATMLACESNQIEVLCVLLAFFPDVEAADHQGETALMKAATSGHNSCIVALLFYCLILERRSWLASHSTAATVALTPSVSAKPEQVTLFSPPQAVPKRVTSASLPPLVKTTADTDASTRALPAPVPQGVPMPIVERPFPSIDIFEEQLSRLAEPPVLHRSSNPRSHAVFGDLDATKKLFNSPLTSEVLDFARYSSLWQSLISAKDNAGRTALEIAQCSEPPHAATVALLSSTVGSSSGEKLLRSTTDALRGLLSLITHRSVRKRETASSVAPTRIETTGHSSAASGSCGRN
jgi:ankyrin repeat protein